MYGAVGAGEILRGKTAHRKHTEKECQGASQEKNAPEPFCTCHSSPDILIPEQEPQEVSTSGKNGCFQLQETEAGNEEKDIRTMQTI